MIVVDANILAFYFVEGTRTNDATTLRGMDPEWIVPAFWCIEFQSILWKYVRFGGMPPEKALELLDQAQAILAENEVTPSPERVLRDAMAWKITVYDAQYVSLAKQHGIYCVTEDVPVQEACPGIAISLTAFIHKAPGENLVREKGPGYRVRHKRTR